MRELKGNWSRFAAVLAIALAAFHLLTGTFGLLPSAEQRAVHVALGLGLIFCLYPARKSGAGKSGIPWWDILLIVLLLVTSGNIFVNWTHYQPIMEETATPFELALAVAAMLVILEAGRRTIGWVFPILTALAAVYALWGHYIPGEFGHAPMKARVILENIYCSVEGIWGFLTGLSSTYIALFIIFGAILLTTGGGKTFIDLAMLIAGKFRGGPAKVAVLASGFFAMLSGSSLANVATTGSFTIPLMKKLGYSPDFAGGVEATASTGGIVTPPIMGAAAFIMAEFLGISYLKVIIAAAIPAFLFYVAVFMGVHFQAVKLNLRPIPREELPPIRSVLTVPRIAGLVLPIGTLLYVLLNGYSLIMVATSASLMAIAVYIFSNLSPRSILKRLQSLIGTLETAGKAVIAIVPVLVCANIVLSLLEYTALGVKFSKLVIGLGEANLPLSLFMTGILVMILGCGLPITAAYVLGIVVAAPLLAGWGILPLAAHLFILYYAILAGLTPPVCPAVFLGAHIAQANWLKTAWVALRLAPLLYILPFIIVFDPTFIMVGAAGEITMNVGTAAIGAIVLVSGTMGQLITKANIFESLLLVAAGLLLVIPGFQTDLLGAVLVAVITAKQLWQRKRGSQPTK